MHPAWQVTAGRTNVNACCVPTHLKLLHGQQPLLIATSWSSPLPRAHPFRDTNNATGRMLEVPDRMPWVQVQLMP